MSAAKKFLYGAFIIAVTVALIYMGMNVFKKASGTVGLFFSIVKQFLMDFDTLLRMKKPVTI